MTARLGPANSLTPDRVERYLVPFIEQYYRSPVTLSEVERISRLHDDAVADDAEGDRETREAAWKRLVNVFLSSASLPVVVASAGYQLSWCFPTVNDGQKQFLQNRMSAATDAELSNVIDAMHWALSDGCDDVADHLAGLLEYVPGITERLANMGRQRAVNPESLEALFQAVEYVTEGFQEALREEILGIYGMTTADLP